MSKVDPVVGYLYLVLHTGQLPEGRWAALRMSFGRPALGLILAIVALTTLATLMIIVSVTRLVRQVITPNPMPGKIKALLAWAIS